MAKSSKTFDTTRASKDGHEFHEAWVARKCLGLLLPTDDFIGLAIEGFSASDQKSVSAEANEIADAVLYYGTHASFDGARQVVVVQVKYSKAAEHKPFRAADAKKTLEKFAITYRSHKKDHGAKLAREKLRFELVTNRPILAEFNEAIVGLCTDVVLHGTAKAQANQIKAACMLEGKDLVEFASRLQIVSLGGDLRESKHLLAIAIADWSPACDPMARIRLNSIRELARDKANLANQKRNVIARADILTALELQDDDDLLPCPASFPSVGPAVNRRQLTETVAKIPLLDRPLVIHADGGVGKTVFMNSIAGSLAPLHEVVLFDCFGMGQYRAPGDARHLPRRGLIHIANDLACRGLCDPLLPTTDNGDELIRAFRLRMTQAAQTVRRAGADRQLILLIDAIDNAGELARDRGEPSFPKLLLQSFTLGGLIPGVQLVVSSRSHRRVAATGGVSCEEVELNPFTIEETGEFLQHRVNEMTDARLQVAQSRSRGNARILEHLTNEGSDLLAPSEIDNVIQLDDLLRKRIEDALKEARTHGYQETDIKAFLAGLATLPPPVPLREFAEANGLAEGAVRSFAADLSPLLEQTKHGLMFRDEPTETLIRESYSADKETLRTLAKNLNGMQAASIYAATTLPDLLQQLEDGEQLFSLAFDERIPAAIKSTVGRQAIRHARLRAAVAYAANRNEADRLVSLLVELSTLAVVDQRGTRYILDNPDLTVLSSDADSVRRLFEVRTPWPGTRHAGLTIAHALMGDLADAHRHAHRLHEWRQHYFQQDTDYKREKAEPTLLDMASIPFCLIAKGDGEKAAGDIARWVDWYAFEVAESLFSLVRNGMSIGCVDQDVVHTFLTSIVSKPGVLAAAIPFCEGDEALQRLLLTNLARACDEGVNQGENHNHRQDRPIIRGLLVAASVASVLGMNAEAAAILSAAQIPRPSLHTYMDSHWTGEVYPFLAKQVLFCIAKGEVIEERHLLPTELSELATNIPPNVRGQEFKKALKVQLETRYQAERAEGSATKQIGYETKNSAERFLDNRLESWLQVSLAFAQAIHRQSGQKSRTLTPLINLWIELRNKPDYYSGRTDAQRQHNAVGERLLTLALGADPTLAMAEIQRYVEAVSDDDVTVVSNVIQIVGILATRPSLQALAGATSFKAKAAIERSDEVDQRASLFADLARAILPASRNEANEYFRKGLEQMDAIGSGDYQFVNELMQFTSSLHGEELADQDSHTLSNICELNLGEEHKFNWAMYGSSMVKASGLRGLAKLARWEDRNKISLNYTLLPYLRALLECGKIDPAVALVMLRVSNPVELYVCGTEQLAETFENKPFDRLESLTQELFTQYRQNNPSSFGADAPRALARLAKRALGEASPECAYFSVLADQIKSTTSEYNELNNWRAAAPAADIQEQQKKQDAALESLKALAAETDPLDELSVAKAMEVVEDLNIWGRSQRNFFEQLRPKVPFSGWPRYIEIIAQQKGLDLYDKLHELAACKDAWSGASNSVATSLHNSAEIIVRENASEFISFDYLSASHLKDLAELSGFDHRTLTLTLIKEFSRPDMSIPASVWLSLATTFNKSASSGVGQDVIKRLLNSGPAKLASSVADGPWEPGLYPVGEQVEVAAGLIWFALGSPDAERRWMGAHSLRTALRLGRTEVIDAVIAKFDMKDAGPFHAQELPFFYLHAQLWLLIALARIALDDPGVIAKHHVFIEKVALDKEDNHVLRKHFSTRALLTCVRGGRITLSGTILTLLDSVNRSPYPLETSTEYGGNSFYSSRPENIPEPKKELHLEYDFGKHDVSRMGDLFGRPFWDTADAINAWVRTHDAEITHMSDSRARPRHRRSGSYNMSAEHHSYGEHLCWHALHAVAGEFLTKYPVVRRSYDTGSPWDEWLARKTLTRGDDLWLADGTDWRPVETMINIREISDKGAVLTGASSKLLSILGIEKAAGEWMVIGANWESIDGIDVQVQSALVHARGSTKIAKHVAKQDPFQAFLPQLNAYDEDDSGMARSHAQFTPWVVLPDAEVQLEEGDSLGVIGAAQRGRLSKVANAFGHLVPKDPFGRIWADPSDAVMVRSEAWCQQTERGDGGRTSGTRLLCHSDFVREFLADNKSHLLLLVILQRRESGYGSIPSRFWHTTAVVQVTESLDFTFHAGRSNELHESQS